MSMRFHANSFNKFGCWLRSDAVLESRHTEREHPTRGTWARHVWREGATRETPGRDTPGKEDSRLGAQGGAVGGSSGGDCGVAGGGGFSDGEGAIWGAEAQCEGQRPLAGTDLIAGVDVEQAHVLE